MKKLSKKAKAMKRGLAVLLAAVLMMSAVPTSVVQASVPEIPAETGELQEGGSTPEIPAEGDAGQQPGGGEETPSPDEGTTQTPGEGDGQTPDDGTTPAPGEGDGQTPDDGTTQTPVEGDGQTPDDGTTQTPVEGDGQTPGDGTTQTPVEGDGQTPDDGTTQTPVEGDGQTPDDGTTQTPGEGDGQTPGDGTTQTPVEGNGQKPGDGTTQTPVPGETDSKPVIGPDGTVLAPGADLLKPDQALVSEEKTEEETEVEVTDEVFYNTGNHVWQIVNEEAFNEGEIGDGCFEEDGSYTIYIPEPNPLFPYEVQFIYEDEVTNHWFMSPDDSVEIGGHCFYVTADFDDSAVIQMSLNVGGDTILIYPEEKEFTNDGDGASPYSLQPLEERRLRGIDLTAYTPAELTMVSVDYLFKNGEAQNAENVVWTYSSYDDFEVSAVGDKLDLSWGTSYSSSPMWQIIVGSADQLDTGNIRYLVTINVTPSSEWLEPTVFTKDASGNRKDITVMSKYYSDSWSIRDDNGRRMRIYMASSQASDVTQGDYYVTLAEDDSLFSNRRYQSMKIFEGQYTSAAEAASGTDITEALRSSGYALRRYQEQWVTMVTYDGNGNVTGCLPFQLYLSTENDENYISMGSMFKRAGTSSRDYVTDTMMSRTENGCVYRTYKLYAEYPANDTYYLTMSYYQAGNPNSSAVTAAYAGQYSSIAQAAAAGASDIKGLLFGGDYSTAGYGADYSQGVYLTVFVGQDGAAEQEIYQYCIKTETGTNPKKTSSSATNVSFYGLKDSDGNRVKAYVAKNDDDSYGDNNYRTILVENTTDLTKLAPVFSTGTGINLYAENVLQVSGESLHDFSKGAIQYTASSEDGQESRNYWLQVVPVNSGKRLYIDSLADESANTWTDDNGVIHSTREMMLDGYHNYWHDILLVNAGTEDIENLDVELVSDNVELDEYWTLHGEHKLSAVTTVDRPYDVSYGELSNLAKLRLKAKDGIEAGTDVSGTLTIKSGSDVLIVLTLTGTIGNPCIITKEIPQAVKYVPYGVMIQNNNKYSWNKTSYSLQSGTLPEGMSVMPNGELYGVPMETGEFTFTVRMKNSSSYFSNSEKTFTLVVVENTDVNVDAATDNGYDITQRVQGSAVSESGSQTLVSQGQYSEFEYVYLDGVKLEEGTDYTSEEGSTRITIRNQTLAGSDGTHTIGVEFRMKDEDNELRRAAQNYTIESAVSPDDPDDNPPDNDDSDNGSNGSDSSDSGSSTGNSSSGTGSSQTAGTGVNGQNKTGLNQNTQTPAAVNAEAPITYTIQAGDTLWKIAEKYYGSGTYWKKIYTDNAAVIQDPDKIYVGQIITIYPIQGTIAATGTMSAAEGSYYTVEAGDTLWKIAQKVYGKGWQWRKIYQANKDQISEPGNIFVGQVIFIPD